MTLDDETLSVENRFAVVMATVDLIADHRFLSETGLQFKTMLGAIQRACKLLLSCSIALDLSFKKAVERVRDTPLAPDFYPLFEALEGLHRLSVSRASDPTPVTITRKLADAVWQYVQFNYYEQKGRTPQD